MDDREFFDRIAETWDDNEVLSTPTKVNKVLDYFDLKEKQQVLDLGTGTGVLLPYIAERIGKEGKIVAIDFSLGMLSLAKKKFGSLTPVPIFMNLDFENDLIPEQYDRIILYCVYPHLHSPIDTLKWLEKVNLKEEGIISIAFPSGPEFINKIHKEKHSHSDILPSAQNLAEYFIQNGLNALVVSESDDCYVINIKKKSISHLNLKV